MKETICLLLFSICVWLLPFEVVSQVKSPAARSVKKKKKARVQYGTASIYHSKFNGRHTANGDVFSQKKFTCAHNNVPLGTWIRVTNLKNNRSVIVRVIDRLHRRNKRLIDLSRTAATTIGFSKAGLLRVRVEVLDKYKPVVNRK